MEHLKLFEEISSTTLRSAARKLKKLQHLQRVKSLEDYAKIKEREEILQKWQKRIEDYSPEGKFKFRIHTGEISNPVVIEDDFYLYLSVQELDTLESVDEEDSPNIKGIIRFETGIIPKNREVLDKIESSCENPFFYNGFFWSGSITLYYTYNIDTKEFSFVDFDSYQSGDIGQVIIADRKSAVKLRKLFVEIFTGKETYPSGYTDISDMKKKVEDIMIRKLNIEGFKSEYISEFFNKISVNVLYKD